MNGQLITDHEAKVMFLLMFVCPQGVCIPEFTLAGSVYPSMHLGRVDERVCMDRGV